MQHIYRVVQSKHKAKKIYDIVNDTESYEQFIPFCKKSEVEKWFGHERKRCLLVFSHLGITCQLVTINTLRDGQRIDIALDEGPFSMLKGHWVFEDNDDGCQVTIDFQYTFENYVLEVMFDRVFRQISEGMVDLFCERADG